MGFCCVKKANHLNRHLKNESFMEGEISIKIIISIAFCESLVISFTSAKIAFASKDSMLAMFICTPLCIYRGIGAV